MCCDKCHQDSLDVDTQTQGAHSLFHFLGLDLNSVVSLTSTRSELVMDAVKKQVWWLWSIRCYMYCFM